MTTMLSEILGIDQETKTATLEKKGGTWKFEYRKHTDIITEEIEKKLEANKGREGNAGILGFLEFERTPKLKLIGVWV